MMRIEIIQELSGRFMEICTGESKESDFGNEMLRHNEIKGLLGGQIHCVDQEERRLYDIGDMPSIKEYFQDVELTASRLQWILEQLIAVIRQAPEYFLDEKNYVLIPDYIFYDEEENQVKIAYLDGFAREVSQGFAAFLEMCMNVMNHHDKELVFLVYGLHKICKEEHFTMAQLTQFIMESRQKRETNGMSTSVHQRNEASKSAASKSAVSESAALKDATSQSVVSRGVTSEGEKGSQGKSKRETGARKVTMRVSSPLFLALAVVVFLVIMKSGMLTTPVTGQIDVTKAAIVILALGLCVAYGLRRMGKEKDGDKATLLADTNVTSYQAMDQTVLLTQQEETQIMVNLIPVDWHRSEMKIRKTPFYIGKETDKSDGVIEEAEVSRVHAKVVMEEGNVYLVDQESTNGTFINGARSVPWERCQVKDGDKIGIATVFYTVEILS